MDLLVLDLDGTITKNDNLVGFSLFMFLKKRKIRFALFFPLFTLLRFKMIDNLQFKIWYAQIILKNMDVHSVQICTEEYIKSNRFKESVNQEVIGFINHKSNSDKMILSANYDFIVKAAAQSIGIRNFESINLEQKNGRYTGNIIGTIPFGSGKIDVFKKFIQNLKYNKTIGLGDSLSDLFILKYLDEGYMVSINSRDNTTLFMSV